jgi:hypothetical protein
MYEAKVISKLLEFCTIKWGPIRDALARDEPTRTCCGPLPSWAPKIKTLELIKNIDFNFENQD